MTLESVHSQSCSRFLVILSAQRQRSPAAARELPRGRLVQRMLGRPPVVAESQFLDVSEFAEIAIERAERQVTGFPRNLQDQAI